MEFPTPLIRGRLIRRYKRFLADVRLDDGQDVTAHCANPGAMTGLVAPDTVVWLSRSDNPKRKLAYSWEMVELEGAGAPVYVGINTAHPNRLAEEAIAAGKVPALSGYERIRREVRYGQKSRIDLLLEADDKPPCYVEVKNVHLMRDSGLAEFPDSVTTRGARHLAEMADMVRDGARAVMFYLVQRGDADRFTLAADIDPAYAEAFRVARETGVEAVCHICQIDPTGIRVTQDIPVVFPA